MQRLFFSQLFGKNSDLPLINSIASLMEERKNVILFDNKLDSYKQQAVISELDYFISNRYHTIVFSLLRGIPSICISYQFKSSNLMERIGLKQFSVDISNLSSEVLLEKFNLLISNKEKIRETISKNIEYLKNKATLNSIIFNLLVYNNRKTVEIEVKKHLSKK